MAWRGQHDSFFNVSFYSFVNIGKFVLDYKASVINVSVD